MKVLEVFCIDLLFKGGGNYMGIVVRFLEGNVKLNVLFDSLMILF